VMLVKALYVITFRHIPLLCLIDKNLDLLQMKFDMDILKVTYSVVRFEVLMVACMKMVCFWVVASCSLIVVY
jgi:hypothetical protein